jgi:predicted metal-binding membrane protein
MAVYEHNPHARPVIGIDAAAVLTRRRRSFAVPALIAGSWLLLLVAEATGVGAALHHHALIEGGAPLALAIPAFLVGWLVMVAAMMLPASFRSIHAMDTATAWMPRRRRARAAFLGAFALVWTAFGLVAFLGDVGLHHVVDATPWLAERPWLIAAGVLALAGGYQLVPLKRRSLAACRHPVASVLDPGTLMEVAGRLGLRHGLACLGSSWALMLLMFAEGVASLGWVAGLTILMFYEATGRHGQRAASAAGLTLILAAVAVLSGVSGPSA